MLKPQEIPICAYLERGSQGIQCGLTVFRYTIDQFLCRYFQNFLIPDFGFNVRVFAAKGGFG